MSKLKGWLIIMLNIFFILYIKKKVQVQGLTQIEEGQVSLELFRLGPYTHDLVYFYFYFSIV